MNKNEEFNLKEFLGSFLNYKLSIVFITVSMIILAIILLYFKPNIYNSTSIIEVKSTDGGTQGNFQKGDFLEGALSGFGSSNVNKDIEVLKTFHINNKVLKKVKFNTRFYVDKGLKKVEIYEDIPIELQEIKIYDESISGQIIKLIPLEDGYHLQVINTFKNKIMNVIFNKKLIEIDEQRKYKFDKMIKNNYFQFKIEKKYSFREPIYFTMFANNRNIFESTKNNLTINQINPDAPLINISYSDTIPMRATAYVNALALSFIEQSIAEKSKGINRIIDFIEKQLTSIKIKVDKSEKNLEQYRIKNKVIDPSLQGQTYINELSNIEIELSKNELSETIMKNILLFIQQGENIDAIAPSLMELQDKSTLDLIAKLQEAQIEEERLKSLYSPKHPEYIAIRKQIKFIVKKIILNIKNLKSSMSDRNKNLLKLKETYENAIKSLPTQERMLTNLKRDYEVSAVTYKYLLKKKSENEMIKVAVLSDYRVIDSGFTNYVPVSPKRTLFIIIFFFLGLILGISQAIIRNLLNDNIQSKKDIENLTNLPIYGALPQLSQKSIGLEVFKDTKSTFAESYRSLRTNLQFSRKQNRANIILVTSTLAGEGKSTIVANLGAVFQMANYKCIVINIDLRKPTLHHYFEVDTHVGMSTYLSGNSEIEDIIQTTKYQNLDIITSGPIPPNPSELILSERLSELIDKLKEVYDYIIMDSAPIGLVTDTMHLMQYSDLNLIVVRANYAKKSFISDLNNLVDSNNLKNIGIVINAIDKFSVGTYGYGYGYGYGLNEEKNQNILYKIKNYF